MATYVIREDGYGDFTNLQAALSNGSVVDGDIINILGNWNNADITAAVATDELTITCTPELAKHKGFVEASSDNGSEKHYRLGVASVSGGTAFELQANCTLDGLTIIQTATSGGSNECLSVYTDNITATIKNCIIFQEARIDNGDCFYTDSSDGVFVFENCLIYGAERGGIHDQSQTPDGGNNFDINSCTLLHNGHDDSDGGSGEISGSFGIAYSDSAAGVIRIFNSIFMDGTSTPYEAVAVANSSTVDISYSIDDDGSIATYDDGSGVGNLGNRTLNTATGGGDEVIITTNGGTTYGWYDVDCRLVDDVTNNDAQEAHSVLVAEGLTLPVYDLAGFVRDRTNVDIGAYAVTRTGPNVQHEEYDVTIFDAAWAGDRTVTGFDMTNDRTLGIVVGVRHEDDIDVTLSITDTESNTYTHIGRAQAGSSEDMSVDLFYCLDPVSSASVDVSTNFGANVGYIHIHVSSFSYDGAMKLGAFSEADDGNATHLDLDGVLNAAQGEISFQIGGAYSFNVTAHDDGFDSDAQTTELSALTHKMGAYTGDGGFDISTTPQQMVLMAASFLSAETVTLDQYAYRFFDVNAAYATADDLAAQDTGITLAVNTSAVVAFGIQATGDPETKQFKARFRKVGDADSEWEPLA